MVNMSAVNEDDGDIPELVLSWDRWNTDTLFAHNVTYNNSKSIECAQQLVNIFLYIPHVYSLILILQYPQICSYCLQSTNARWQHAQVNA